MVLEAGPSPSYWVLDHSLVGPVLVISNDWDRDKCGTVCYNCGGEVVTKDARGMQSVAIVGSTLEYMCTE
jgi:hypothetical protein